MIYTKNKRANKLIVSIINSCKQIIISKCQPDELLLGGSYSRGEGLVLNTKNFVFVSDLDIYIIGKREIANTIKQINITISNKIFKLYNSKIDINLQYVNINKQHDDMSTLDLKYQSKLIYGQPLHKSIKINEERALKTAIRFLMAKSKYLLYIKKGTPKKEVITICSKVYAEMSVVLCSKQGVYRPTYFERCLILKNINNLDKKMVDRIIKFTKYKIGFNENFHQNKTDIYNQTLEDLFLVWSLILNIPLNTVKETGNIFKQKLTEAFFEAFIEEFFDKHFGIKNPPYKKVWLYLIQIYDCIPLLVLFKRYKIQNVYIDEVTSPYIQIYQRIMSSLSKNQLND